MGFFWGRFLIQGLFFGGGGVTVGSPRDFLGFSFLPSFDHPCHLKSVVPWACYTASKFLWAACLLRPFWFAHAKWPHINCERFIRTVPFKSKLTICCESWFSTRFAILDFCTNGEWRTSYRESSQGPSLSRQKTTDAPITDFSIILQRPTVVTQHGKVIFAIRESNSMLERRPTLIFIRVVKRNVSSRTSVSSFISSSKISNACSIMQTHSVYSCTSNSMFIL